MSESQIRCPVELRYIAPANCTQNKFFMFLILRLITVLRWRRSIFPNITNNRDSVTVWASYQQRKRQQLIEMWENDILSIQENKDDHPTLFNTSHIPTVIARQISTANDLSSTNISRPDKTGTTVARNIQKKQSCNGEPQ